MSALLASQEPKHRPQRLGQITRAQPPQHPSQQQQNQQQHLDLNDSQQEQQQQPQRKRQQRLARAPLYGADQAGGPTGSDQWQLPNGLLPRAGPVGTQSDEVSSGKLPNNNQGAGHDGSSQSTRGIGQPRSAPQVKQEPCATPASSTKAPPTIPNPNLTPSAPSPPLSTNPAAPSTSPRGKSSSISRLPPAPPPTPSKSAAIATSAPNPTSGPNPINSQVRGASGGGCGSGSKRKREDEAPSGRNGTGLTQIQTPARGGHVQAPPPPRQLPLCPQQQQVPVPAPGGREQARPVAKRAALTAARAVAELLGAGGGVGAGGPQEQSITGMPVTAEGGKRAAPRAPALSGGSAAAAPSRSPFAALANALEAAVYPEGSGGAGGSNGGGGGGGRTSGRGQGAGGSTGEGSGMADRDLYDMTTGAASGGGGGGTCGAVTDDGDGEGDECVDDDEDPEKARERREKNRIAARKCRAKKVAMVRGMQEELKELVAQNQEMKMQVVTWHRMFSREVKLREAMKRVILAVWSGQAIRTTGYTANDVIIGLESGTLDVNSISALLQRAAPHAAAAAALAAAVPSAPSLPPPTLTCPPMTLAAAGLTNDSIPSLPTSPTAVAVAAGLLPPPSGSGTATSALADGCNASQPLPPTPTPARLSASQLALQGTSASPLLPLPSHGGRDEMGFTPSMLGLMTHGPSGMMGLPPNPPMSPAQPGPSGGGGGGAYWQTNAVGMYDAVTYSSPLMAPSVSGANVAAAGGPPSPRVAVTHLPTAFAAATACAAPLAAAAPPPPAHAEGRFRRTYSVFSSYAGGDPGAYGAVSSVSGDDNPARSSGRGTAAAPPSLQQHQDDDGAAGAVRRSNSSFCAVGAVSGTTLTTPLAAPAELSPAHSGGSHDLQPINTPRGGGGGGVSTPSMQGELGGLASERSLPPLPSLDPSFSLSRMLPAPGGGAQPAARPTSLEDPMGQCMETAAPFGGGPAPTAAVGGGGGLASSWRLPSFNLDGAPSSTLLALTDPCLLVSRNDSGGMEWLADLQEDGGYGGGSGGGSTCAGCTEEGTAGREGAR